MRRERKIKKIALRKFPLFLLLTFRNREHLVAIRCHLTTSCSTYAATLHAAIALVLIPFSLIGRGRFVYIHLVLHMEANNWPCTHRHVCSPLLPCVIGSYLTPYISCPHYLEHFISTYQPIKGINNVNRKLKTLIKVIIAVKKYSVSRNK